MKNKKILIVGANSDIGKSLKKKLSKNNDVVTISRNKGKNINHYTIADYSKESVSNSLNWYKGSHASLDIMIIMNGFGRYGKITEIPLEEIDEMVKANLLTPYYFMHYFTKLFIEQKRGNIILLGSVAGIKYSPGFAMYSATKFALRALAEAYRNEFQSSNIKITNIQPGIVNTKFWGKIYGNNKDFEIEEKFTVRAAEIADTIKFILDANSMSQYTINEITCRSVYQER